MIYEIVRDQLEIDALIGKCIDQQSSGVSRFPGMTYEQGIREALEWVIGDTDDDPLPDV